MEFASTQQVERFHSKTSARFGGVIHHISISFAETGTLLRRLSAYDGTLRLALSYFDLFGSLVHEQQHQNDNKFSSQTWQMWRDFSPNGDHFQRNDSEVRLNLQPLCEKFWTDSFWNEVFFFFFLKIWFLRTIFSLMLNVLKYSWSAKHILWWMYRARILS